MYRIIASDFGINKKPNGELKKMVVVAEVNILRENEVAQSKHGDSGQLVDDYHKIAKSVVQHNAMKELDRFGQLIIDSPLDKDNLSFFFATVWEFFKYIPGGIISLAAKITDELMEDDTWEATKQAAYVLYASVDEYGLHQHHKHLLPTHHVLFKELTTHLGLDDTNIKGGQYIKAGGRTMGQLTYDYYRQLSLGEALGFHLASEMTSSREFQYFLKGFQTHAKHYGLNGERDPVLSFFKVHCEVEPMHVSTGKNILMFFLKKDRKNIDLALKGAKAFMDGFEEMFRDINNQIDQK